MWFVGDIVSYYNDNYICIYIHPHLYISNTRAGDSGLYDLEFLHDPAVDVFTMERFAQVMQELHTDLPASHRHGRARHHLDECERRHADPLLLRLLDGESLADVLRNL